VDDNDRAMMVAVMVVIPAMVVRLCIRRRGKESDESHKHDLLHVKVRCLPGAPVDVSAAYNVVLFRLDAQNQPFGAFRVGRQNFKATQTWLPSIRTRILTFNPPVVATDVFFALSLNQQRICSPAKAKAV
jgi:hypothetical protein